MEVLLTQFGMQTLFHVNESSQIAFARRACADLARNLGFDETQAGKVSIVITEACTNLLKHAGGGDLIVRSVQRGTRSGIEILAIDSGPGIANVAASICDGVSTAGTQGTGLGAMRRLSDEFDIYSQSGKGTAILLVVLSVSEPSNDDALLIGGVCLPLPSEDVSGDAWTCRSVGNTTTILVADGLGHGPDARAASQPAIDLIERHGFDSPTEVLNKAHDALRGTRGAAVAVAMIAPAQNRLSFAGVGNIAAFLFNREGRKQFMSHNGIVGSNMRRVQEFDFDWNEHSMLILHSDGLLTNWNLDQYPGLESRAPALIAAVLVRDFSRKRDDITVVVVRPNQL